MTTVFLSQLGYKRVQKRDTNNNVFYLSQDIRGLRKEIQITIVFYPRQLKNMLTERDHK